MDIWLGQCVSKIVFCLLLDFPSLQRSDFTESGPMKENHWIGNREPGKQGHGRTMPTEADGEQEIQSVW